MRVYVEEGFYLSRIIFIFGTKNGWGTSRSGMRGTLCILISYMSRKGGKEVEEDKDGGFFRWFICEGKLGIYAYSKILT
jgi:hypothetical protein